MKWRLALLFLISWFLTGAAWGQVKVKVLLDQKQFLPGEEVPIKVRVINYSGQTLDFGEDDSWLRLTVLSEGTFVVEQTGEIPVKGRFELPPSKMATKNVDIAPYFNFSRPGRYSVVATVHVNEWNEDLTSDPADFDVIHGSKLWEKAFGVPNPQLPDGAPEVRKYLLQQANHLRSQIVLYVRITDASENRTIKVVPIGPMVSFSEPKAQIDKNSNLHVLYQSGPKVSTYFAIDPDGNVLAQEKFEYSSVRPRLSAAEDGSVNVQGGVKKPVAPSQTPHQEPIVREHDES